MFLRVLRLTSLFLAVAGIFWICTFKVLDRDFWWHIKAGEIMWKTGSLIVTDPFAHTREGLPYISSHHWLAQIAMYSVWSVGGATAQIFFRGALVAGAFLFLLLVDTKRVFPNFFVVLIAAYFNRPSFMDRPQLFSFLFFCAFLWAATYYLRRSDADKNLFSAWRKWFLIALVLLQILWVNTHGAAATYGIIIMFALMFERASEWLRGVDSAPRVRALNELKYLAFTILLLGVSALFSPNGLRTFQDVFVYTSDQTLGLVREWQPRGTASYMKDIAPFVLLVSFSLIFGKLHRVYSTALALVFGYLSTQAYRHGIFFIFAALSIVFYQAGTITWYRKKLQELLHTPYVALGGAAILLACMVWFARYDTIHVLTREGYSGYGTAAAAEGAYAFVEKNNIQGNMFNTYAIGDYLLYRGYPNRKVYMDGRNIDYGYEFMNATFQGGLDGESWKVLEDKYNLSYAAIDYMAIAKVGRAGYSIHLDKNPAWRLVYVDDWTAVYVKNIPENKDIIQKLAYEYVNPINIDKGAILDEVTPENTEKMIVELQRAADGNPDGVKARILLARLLVSERNFAGARSLLDEVRAVEPHLADTYQILAGIAQEEQQYIEAAQYYSTMLKYTGKAYPNINYHAIADVFEKAGHPLKATYYRYLAQPEVEAPKKEEAAVLVSPLRQEATGGAVGEAKGEDIGELFAGIGEDITRLNDEGSSLGEQGKFSEAEAKFLEALKLDPSNPQTLNNLGVLSLQKKDDAAALDYFTRALERSEEYPDAHYNLAILYYRQQKYAEAQEEVRLAEKYGRDVKSILEAIKRGR